MSTKFKSRYDKQIHFPTSLSQCVKIFHTLLHKFCIFILTKQLFLIATKLDDKIRMQLKKHGHIFKKNLNFDAQQNFVSKHH